MIHFGTWVWGKKYASVYVERLEASLKRNLTIPYRFHIWKPPAEDKDLTKIPGCFARLRTFDPGWQKQQGIVSGEKIVVLDLDLVITGNLDTLFNNALGFSILQGVNAANPCPYNGSVWALDAGYRADVWADFSLEAAGQVPHHDFPDDQAWFAAKMPLAGRLGPETGVYAFRKPGWSRKSDELPEGAKIVAFPGHRDPSHFTWIPWVTKHWRI